MFYLARHVADHPDRRRPAGSAEAMMIVCKSVRFQAGIIVTAIMVALASVATSAETPRNLVVTRCDVSLHGSTTPGPKLYQYRATVVVFNRSAEPAQFVRVDVSGLTRDGATEWAPVEAYFDLVPSHSRNQRAGGGEPMNLSWIMRNGVDPDRPTHGFRCHVRSAGAPSPARPIER